MPPTGLESMSEVSLALRSMPASVRVLRIPRQSPVSVCCSKRPSSAATGLPAGPSKTATKNSTVENLAGRGLIAALGRGRPVTNADHVASPARGAPAAAAPRAGSDRPRRPTGRAARRQQPRRGSPQLLRLLAKLGVGLARNIVNGPGRVLWMTRQCRRARIRHSAPRPGAKLLEQPTRTIAAATPSRRSVRDGRPEIRKKPFLTPSTMPNKSKRLLGGCYTNMTDDLKNTSTMEAAAEDWARVNLPPRLTGLPMAVWITENDGYPRDVRV